MLLDDIADRGQQTWDVASLHPAPAFRIEYRLEFLGDERNVPTASEYGTDHSRQGDRPGVVLEVLRVDEDLERPPPPVAHDVVDRDVECMRACWPLDLVGDALERRVAFKRLRH